jgi:hypothetical protein
MFAITRTLGVNCLKFTILSMMAESFCQNTIRCLWKPKLFELLKLATSLINIFWSKHWDPFNIKGKRTKEWKIKKKSTNQTYIFGYTTAEKLANLRHSTSLSKESSCVSKHIKGTWKWHQNRLEVRCFDRSRLKDGSPGISFFIFFFNIIFSIIFNL